MGGRSKLRNHKTRTANSCIFCGGDEADEVIFGKFFHRATVSVHQNCMFFSSGLVQRGRKARDGIMRFLIADLKQEANRGNKLKCCYCKNLGATIGCIVNNCRKSFHFPCGIKHHALNQHFDNFASYCHVHKPRQKSVKVNNEPYCYICCISLGKDELEDCLYSPCCKNNWFHRLCIQKYALSAGRHFFKCPLCNNSTDFVKEMVEYGVCIPDKDAAWELENNAYQDLLFRPACGASTCKCKQGRKHEGKGPWTLLACFVCGADARHKNCGNVMENSWKCSNCEIIEAAIGENKQRSSIIEEISEQGEGSVSGVLECAENTSVPSSSSLIVPKLEKDDNIPSVHLEDMAVDCIKSEIMTLESDIKSNEGIAVDESVSINTTNGVISSCLQELNIIKVEAINNAVPVVTRKRKAGDLCKVTKSKQKRCKVKPVNCCDNSSNRCIREMFGLECQSYRFLKK